MNGAQRRNRTGTPSRGRRVHRHGESASMMLKSKNPVTRTGSLNKWCPEAESNHRHGDFQSPALPTELSGHVAFLLQRGRI